MSQKPFHILLAPNAYKGSLTAASAARVMEAAVLRLAALPNGRPFTTQRLPLADGGDGTLETLVDATGGTLFTATVSDPLGRPISARWGRLGGTQKQTAVIEMAEANGLRLLTPQERAPYLTSTYGTGQLMRTAVEAGCTTLLIGIGGSATNDGGAGMAQALGAKLLNGEGKEIPRGGGALSQLARIDKQHWLLPTEVRVLVACDVDNPLCGAQGATAIYGPQKGVQPHDVPVLDANLAHFAEVIAHDLGADVAERAGAGAAGGLGAGLMAFCGAEVRSGIEWVMEEVGFTQALAHSDLVLTGEGRIDNQTGRGKVIAGVARRAQAQGVPVVAIAGAVEEGCEAALRSIGLTAAISMMDAPQTLEEAMSATESLLSRKVEQVLALIGIGIR